MKVITAGYARALNQMMNGTLGAEYTFAVPVLSVDDFFVAFTLACRNELNSPGHDWFTGNDVTISVDAGPPGDGLEYLLLPADTFTLGYLKIKLGY